MNETVNQQDTLEPVSHSQGFDDTVSVDVSDGDISETVTDITNEYVATGDVVTEVVSGGDVETSTPEATTPEAITQTTTQFMCTCTQKELLWESDISNFDTTDGLLLLILIFTMLNTALNVFRK